MTALVIQHKVPSGPETAVDQTQFTKGKEEHEKQGAVRTALLANRTVRHAVALIKETYENSPRKGEILFTLNDRCLTREET
jgi:hypothetical protein